MAERPIRVGDRTIGRGQPAYLVAEMSGNHNGDIRRAIAIIHAAAEAGADAVKLQTYTPDTLTIACDRPDFVVPGQGPWSGRTLYDLYREAHTPYEWHPRLFETARGRGIQIFSTPFDDSAVRLLEQLGVPAYKVASFEMVDDGLLRIVGRTGKPVILSTGMASLEEIAHAVATLRAAGSGGIVVLKCTSSYPAPDAEMRLATIPVLGSATGCPVGLSDHSLGGTAAVSAVMLGACLIEKHFTLSRAEGGVDSQFSLEPAEFHQLVTEVRRAEAMLGEPGFGPGIAEEGSVVFRRSLYVVEDVKKGAALTPRNVRSIRPGYGLSPRYLDLVIGKKAARACARGTPVTWDLVGEPIS
jgi:pseudaminic acid synthase